MPKDLPSPERLRQVSAAHVIPLIQSGMRVGLGTGRTVNALLEPLAQRIHSGLRITCIASSIATQRSAEFLDIPLTDLSEIQEIDLTIDGADEIDEQLNLIKGGGGALLREKVLASASKRVVIIAEYTKKHPNLGQFPLPVEVVPFAVEVVKCQLYESLIPMYPQLRIVQRGTKEGAYVTDNHNYILDLHLASINDPARLSTQLREITGVVEHGICVKLADEVHLAKLDDDGVPQVVTYYLKDIDTAIAK